MPINENYQQSTSIDTSREKVFQALTNEVGLWWGPVDRPAERVGDIFKIDFGNDSYWKFKVIEVSNIERIVWECIASNQEHNVRGLDEEWLGSKLYWEISEKPEGIHVNFLHEGLVPHGKCYEVCSAAWDFYITDSLKNFLEKNDGKPEGM
ncbi:MAG: SRPBCC domain-containing protein [Cyclobacteriaceae bacterium]|nr:SRPBCC domain-containing protein [Cyclobacteriaceae bacterium HetDA_MAG_MS6]